MTVQIQCPLPHEPDVTMETIEWARKYGDKCHWCHSPHYGPKGIYLAEVAGEDIAVLGLGRDLVQSFQVDDVVLRNNCMNRALALAEGMRR